MKKDPREGERWRETETAWRAREREAKTVLCLGRCTGRGKSDSDIISWLLLGISVGRSIGRPVGRGRTERKRENEAYIRESETVKTVGCSLEYLPIYILRNISDTQIIINIISSSSSSYSSVIGATSLRVHNTFTTWMIPYSPCDTCAGFRFSLIIQGDLPNPYFFHWYNEFIQISFLEFLILYLKDIFLLIMECPVILQTFVFKWKLSFLL